MSDDNKTIIKPRPGQAPAASDKTVIKPRPAGKAADPNKTVISPRSNPGGGDPLATKVSNNPRAGGQQPPGKSNIVQQGIYDLPGLPELIRLASPLLSVISQIKQLDGSLEVESLKRYICKLLNNFTAQAKKITDSDVANKASYAICATIDESVLNTPWGENSAWSQQPLLSVFHQETYGGEKFYIMLDNEVTADVKNFDLIELLYLCLSLGFLGKMRVVEHGQVKAETIRANTYQLLAKNRNRFQRQLSHNIAPLTTEKLRLYSYLPAWLLAAVLTLAGFGIYQHWLVELNKRSDIVVDELALLVPKAPEERVIGDLIRDDILELKKLLRTEIEREILSVDAYANHSTITLHANELFPSGSDEINSAFFPVLDKISKALEAIEGQILVSGHTDNRAIRTAQFPSNWHLSLARATSVSKYMSDAAALKARVLPEGRGDSEPVADNNTQEGRAKNRRVTIELFHSEQRDVDINAIQ